MSFFVKSSPAGPGRSSFYVPLRSLPNSVHRTLASSLRSGPRRTDVHWTSCAVSRSPSKTGYLRFSLRSGPRSPRSPGPRAPSRASFICSGSLDFTGFPLFYVVADLHPPAPSRFIVSAIMLFLINSVSPLL